ncbi:MAG: ABC transporter ATP-binding protein [Oscillospiraceae bacterium]
MLKVEKLNAYYGAVHVLHNISLHVEDSEIVAIIGSNGAGKSTLMKAIMGLVKPRGGSVQFKGETINGKPANEIVRKGIVYIPEGREIFPDMTVLENLEMGAYSKPYSRKEMQEHLDEMYALYPRLHERRSQKAGSLSGGEQQMVAIARGLMSDPALLMCDEPSLGLAPVIVDEMFDAIVLVNQKRKIPVLVVEQNAYMALTISSRCYVLENGVVKNHGDSKKLMDSNEIKEAYLGV